MTGRTWRPGTFALAVLAVVGVSCAGGCTSAPPNAPTSAVPSIANPNAPLSAPAVRRSTSVPTSVRPTPSAAPTTTPPATPPVPPTSSTPRPRPTTPAKLPAARVAAADAAIKRLTGYLGAGGVSIEVRDLRTGATYRYGASGGMLSGSISKLYILEVLLLQHQRAGDRLDGEEDRLATAMIERSDNDAANDLYVRIGQGAALRKNAAALGVHNTKPGPGIYWGFNLTCAADYIGLLRNLTGAGVLAGWSRKYALGLLSNVEADQRWGVSAAADHRADTLVKNGWLGASPDNFRWLVNSVGLVTADGRPLAVAVLTQHGRDFAGGITLVEQLARISVHAVTGR